MAGEPVGHHPKEAPAANYARGLQTVDIPELGPKISGKVRDSWVVDLGGGSAPVRVMVSTDRTSAYDRAICAVPGKGAVLNELSAFWFRNTADIISNHMIEAPHPNVLIARQAEATLPIEVVVRRYMAESATKTSVFHNYENLGRRNIYGIDFPDGLVANQEFSETILTPTTKGVSDDELTDEEARGIVDGELGAGIWDQARGAALAIFERGRQRAEAAGLILVDTKYEFGLDADGKLMLIDEVHTPDSSRYWLKSTYDERFAAGAAPDKYDKEILRAWLKEQGFKGDGPVPVVDPAVIDLMSAAYRTPYELLTGQSLPDASSDPSVIREVILQNLSI